jgi:hypothetical protein
MIGILRAGQVKGGPDLKSAEDTATFIETWLGCFEDCDDEELIKATKTWIMDPKGDDKSQFWPTPAQLRAQIPRLSKAREIADRDTGEDAWELVVNQVRLVGSYGDPHFDDATEAAVRAMGGWENLCASLTLENMGFTRRDFLKSYHATVQRTRLELAPPNIRPLLGET